MSAYCANKKRVSKNVDFKKKSIARFTEHLLYASHNRGVYLYSLPCRPVRKMASALGDVTRMLTYLPYLGRDQGLF